MDEEAQKQQDAEFLAGFNGTEAPAPAPEKVAEAASQPEPEKQPEAEAVKDKPKEAGEPPATEEEPDIAGFTKEEIRNLLARAAKVDDLEKEIRKVHGRFGELNGKIQEVMSKPQAKAAEKPAELSQVEEDYPEIAAFVRAQMEQLTPKKEEAPQPAQAEVATQPNLELALMDHLHEGWREKVESRDFNLWLASQADDVRTKYDSAQTAKELSGVLTQFDSWSASRQARSNQGKQRLEQAMTPTGNHGKPKTAPSPQDEFVSGFKSVMAR